MPKTTGARSDWSREEVEAIVSDYFAMLSDELAGVPYSKTEHRRRLAGLLNGRSDGSIEFKHQNISGVLIDLGFPYVSGYLPRSNYQELLYDVVQERMTGEADIVRLAAKDAEGTAVVPAVDDILRALTDPPPARIRRTLADRAARRYLPRRLRLGVNYLEVEARNRSLGVAGEEFVVRYEQARLIKAGRERLAAKIDHVSVTQGDGAGFDVLSFEETGAEKLIEVKTTRNGKETPLLPLAKRDRGIARERGEIPPLPSVRLAGDAAPVHPRRGTREDLHHGAESVHRHRRLIRRPPGRTSTVRNTSYARWSRRAARDESGAGS